MEEALLQILKQMQDEKIAAKKDPNFITRSDLTFGINKMLNELVKSGKIKKGQTLNDLFIKVV